MTGAHTVFYSWQDDIPSKDCRSFIEQALAKAISQLARDLSIDEAVRQEGLAMDKDTAGVAGSPPIVDTIFRKIDAAAAFLADVTFVGTRLDGRPTPNPNVLLEYGWALKSRGYSRIICVMNEAYGEPSDETLPFNMKHLRWPIRYNLPNGADEEARTAARSQLVGDLKSALRAIVQSDDFRESTPQPPKFQAMPSSYGPGRFRGQDEPLGVIEYGHGVPGGGNEVRLANGSALWLRLMPDVQIERTWTIAEIRTIISQAGLILYPLGNFAGWDYLRGPDGFGYVPSMGIPSTHVPSVSFAFKSGEIWTTYVGPLVASRENTFGNVEGMITECLLRCAHVLQAGLGVQRPYRWIAGIDGIKGKRMQRFAPPGRRYLDEHGRPCLKDTVTETGLLGPDDETRLALRQFFVALYDACGEERGDYMDEALLLIPD